MTALQEHSEHLRLSHRERTSLNAGHNSNVMMLAHSCPSRFTICDIKYQTFIYCVFRTDYTRANNLHKNQGPTAIQGPGSPSSSLSAVNLLRRLSDDTHTQHMSDCKLSPDLRHINSLRDSPPRSTNSDTTRLRELHSLSPLRTEKDDEGKRL